MKKISLVLGVVLTMSILFTGCNKDNKEPVKNTEQETVNTEQETADKEQETANTEQETVSTEDTTQNQEDSALASGTIFIENEGRKIPAILTLPENAENVPLVVMNHGFAGNKEEGGGFTRIAEMLADQGIATIRMDFSGCGESETPFTEFNLKNNMSDVKACLNYALNNASIDKEKIGILGYSMGGALSVLLTGEEDSPYKAQVLLAPGTPSGEARREETKQLIEQAQETGYCTIEWFGNELQVGKEYYEGLNEAFAVFESYDNTCDTIVIYGDKDTTVLPEDSTAFAKQMDVEAVEIKDADHGYGFYSDQPDVTKKLQDTIETFFTDKLK